MKVIREHKKILIILVLSIVGIVSIIGGTYAVFFDEKVASNPSSYTTGILSIEGTSGSALSLSDALPITDEEGKSTEPYTFTISNNGNLPYKFDVKLLSTSSTTFSPQYIKLQVDDGEVTTLSGLTNSIIKKDVTLLPGKNIEIKIRAWLSIDTPNTESGKVFNSQIVTDGEAIYNIPTVAVEKITNLYNKAPKTVVTNNSIQYNYANIYDTDSDASSSGGLMDDRLGGTSTILEGSTVILGGGNIRYYGANPNNYIYFNCDDYNNQSADTCELWRIIGVFKDRVKIIRNESIGDYAWDGSNSNNWNTATLKTFLNEAYYNGLKNDATRNKIAEVSWNLGGVNSTVYSNQVYSSERGTTVFTGNSTTWSGNIALMYLSDYGYATDFTKCTQTLGRYGSSTDSYACRSNDWLYNSDYEEWLLTTMSSRRPSSYMINIEGHVIDAEHTSEIYGVRPVLFLPSGQVIVSGNGSSLQPYKLGV